ncbi:hypothetical protein [Vreelandella massiliensis]|uniref:hypothetical protein n=1 Tax=Vreelandella massiliensis TaxID=1816686 RepID=UPI00096A8A54|nr:hypothetical protein [Halomonas massiliensis]
MSPLSFVVGAVMATLSAATIFQHQQISGLQAEIEKMPTVAVVDVDELGTLTALSQSESIGDRQEKITDTLSTLSAAGFLLIDQKQVLTAPADSIVTPKSLLESAGIEVSGELKRDIDLPPRPESQQPQGEDQ